ncbi:c-type cytochrome [Oligoflexus tunisiensis]|uniref:c-type cytochrome n=1 Tax=Oligoflexus tunisiensis TaxID=708132 RepID=UPI00114CE782|nr:hypothetical protein [Oligoflexus tunisiensis]
MSMKDSDVSCALLTAALAGLMGGCGTREKEKVIETPQPLAGVVSATTVDKTLTLASFTALCETRGGLVQTHASCAGANTCAGISYHSSSGRLTEHSCRSANSCGGMSCVDLPADRGLTGAQILEGAPEIAMGAGESQCNYCHGTGQSAFVLPIPPDADPEERKAAFQGKSDAALLGAIAFGIHGVSADGTAYANMPAFYKVYSLAEMKRLVTHLRSLPLETKNWRAVP